MNAEARNDFMAGIIERERGRLKNYIRRRVSSNEDAAFGAGKDPAAWLWPLPGPPMEQ